jgi:endoglucanase
MQVSINKNLGLAALLSLGIATSQAQAAICSYTISNEWNSGFSGTITIINNTATVINGWNVGWQYTANRLTSSWNATVSGSNPYSATGLSWNSIIQPGQSVSFGVQGNKNNSLAAEKPTITGAVCSTSPASSRPASAATSSTPTSVAASSVGTGSLSCVIGNADVWGNGAVLNNIVVTNNGAAVGSWSVTLPFAQAISVTGSWNATIVQSGNTVTASGRNLNAGQSVNFGLQLSHASGSNFVVPKCNGTGIGTGSSIAASSRPTSIAASSRPASVAASSRPASIAASSRPASVAASSRPTSAASSSLGTAGTFRVNAAGNITKNGTVLPVQCGNWFGLEGQHEPKDAENNPDGAPMELYVGNMWWANTGRTVQQTMTEIKAQGINVVRLPIAPQTLDPNDPQGRGDIRTGGVLKNHESVRQSNARQAMEDFIKLAATNNIQVLIDIHSCSNYVGWRKGRLDARPPYTDATRENYDFTREGYSCAPVDDPSVIVHAYNEAKWLANLREIAGLSKSLGVNNIIGIDIFNEPWDYTWSEWKTLSEHAYEAISAVNPDILVFVEGVSGTAGGVKQPHGDETINPNWGENMFGAAADPLNIPKDRVVLSPHTYGPSVFVQRQFMDPLQAGCAELEGEAAGDANCNIIINAAKLKAGWDEHFGFLRDQGYAMVVGEFGGNMDWPAKGTVVDQQRWSHITTNVDQQWQNTFVDYMKEKNIQACYWSINPESGDTAGWYGHSYVPQSNEGGWGTWLGFDARKTTLLKRLWSN